MDVEFHRHGAGLWVERMGVAGNRTGEGSLRICRDVEFHAGSHRNSGDVRFGDRDHQAELRDLLDDEQGGGGAGADKRSGVGQTVRDHAVERCRDMQVSLEFLLRLDDSFRDKTSLLLRLNQRL